jgi:ACS family hexuronate transporter-like MFS transporter
MDNAEEAPTESSKGSRRLLIGLIFVAIALNYVDRQVLALLKPTLEAEFGWNNREYALLGSAFQITAAASFLFIGYVVDRFGVRRALGWGVGLWSLAGIAHAFAATVSQFVAARVALAAAETVGTPAAVKSAAVYLPLKERSFALGHRFRAALLADVRGVRLGLSGGHSLGARAVPVIRPSEA